MSVPSKRASDTPRVIVVAQLAFIGDMVFATPLLDELKAVWSGAQVVVVGRPRALEVLRDHPSVDALVGYDKDARDAGLAGLLRVARALRGWRPELYLGLSRSARTAALARLSGAAARVGFEGGARSLAYTRRAARPEDRPFPWRPLALLEALGLTPARRPLHLVVGEERRETARAALRDAGHAAGEPLVAVLPGANYATKRWSEENVAALLDALAGEGIRPALYGGPAEEELLGGLAGGRPRVLVRKGLSVAETCAELSVADVVVGGDTGPVHVARALGRSVVLLAGPTDPARVVDGGSLTALSRDLECQPCSPSGDDACPLGHHLCMKELSATRVAAAVREALGR
jgi:heptosyltransferase-2